MTKLENRAEGVADRLRDFSQTVDQLSWDLDAALSALRKDAAGYRRRTKANPDGGDNSAPGELEAALGAAERFLARIPAFEVAEPAEEDLEVALGWQDTARRA